MCSAERQASGRGQMLPRSPRLRLSKACPHHVRTMSRNTGDFSAQRPAFMSCSRTVALWNAEVKAAGEGGAPGQWTGNKSGRMAAKYDEKMGFTGKKQASTLGQPPVPSSLPSSAGVSAEHSLSHFSRISHLRFKVLGAKPNGSCCSPSPRSRAGPLRALTLDFKPAPTTCHQRDCIAAYSGLHLHNLAASRS